jgi:lipoprotein signal peptidase
VKNTFGISWTLAKPKRCLLYILTLVIVHGVYIYFIALKKSGLFKNIR